MTISHILLLILASILSFSSHGQEVPEPNQYFYLWANYSLPGNAAQIAGNPIQKPASKFQQFAFHRQYGLRTNRPASDLLLDVLETPLLSSFTLEFWMVHHVNKPLTLDLILGSSANRESGIILSYLAESEKGQKQLAVQAGDKTAVFEMDQPLFQKYWSHLVLAFEGSRLTCYQNGQIIGTCQITLGDVQNLQLSLAGYFEQEPFFKIENLLKKVAVYDTILEPAAIKKLSLEMQKFIEKGIRHEEQFHFTAGPYLHFATENSINLIWETNLAATGLIRFGKDSNLEKQVTFDNAYLKGEAENGSYIYEATIDGLEPQTTYYYNVELDSYDGQKMESGILTFQTAVVEVNPYLFALIGDTETRPHINNQISQMIWQERPDFVLHLGDLTDGGMSQSKWQWNYEYFEGMGPLHQRIPVFPVAGNGEGDLYWYKKYHKLPEDESFYSFKFGNSEFFMLNSNLRANEFAPGGRQYAWLDSALTKSTAVWKFVALHHAPYSTDENDYGNSYEGPSEQGDRHVQQLLPVFESQQVDVVFFGHLHSYSRMGPISNNTINKQRGVWYIQAGGAGGNLEDFAPTKAWFSQKTYPNHHYCTINIMGDQFILKMYDLNGSMRDYFVLDKSE